MEYLDMSYSEPEETQGDNQKIIDLLYFFIDAGITSKEPVDGNELAKELDQESQDLLSQILATKTDSQEKAIVTALINKYKNLDSDKKDVLEFKEHLKNMIDSNAIGYGSFNYLLERVTSGDVKEKSTGLKPAPEQPQEQQPAAEQPQEGQDPNTQGAPAPGVKETNNSDDMNLDYIDEWDNHYSMETDLTEDDFADILGESQEDWVSGNQEVIHAEGTLSNKNSSEEVKNSMNTVPDRAKSFLKAKLKGREVAYSDDSEGFDRAATFLILKEKEYSETLMDKHSNKEGLDHSLDNKSLAYKFLNDKFDVKTESFRVEENFSDENFMGEEDEYGLKDKVAKAGLDLKYKALDVARKAKFEVKKKLHNGTFGYKSGIKAAKVSRSRGHSLVDSIKSGLKNANNINRKSREGQRTFPAKAIGGYDKRNKDYSDLEDNFDTSPNSSAHVEKGHKLINDDEAILLNKDKAKSFMLDKRGNLVTEQI